MKTVSWIDKRSYQDGINASASGLRVDQAPRKNRKEGHRKSWLRGFYDDLETRRKVLGTTK